MINVVVSLVPLIGSFQPLKITLSNANYSELLIFLQNLFCLQVFLVVFLFLCLDISMSIFLIFFSFASFFATHLIFNITDKQKYFSLSNTFGNILLKKIVDNNQCQHYKRSFTIYYCVI